MPNKYDIYKILCKTIHTYLKQDSCMSSLMADAFVTEADEKECFLSRFCLCNTLSPCQTHYLSHFSWTWSGFSGTSDKMTTWVVGWINCLKLLQVSNSLIASLWSLLEQLWKALWESNWLKFLAGSRQNWLHPTCSSHSATEVIVIWILGMESFCSQHKVKAIQDVVSISIL